VYADCKYAIDVNEALTGLTRRVESLNMVGVMLWPENPPKSFKNFPMSRYQWLNVATDVFLIRYVSVVDCALLLVSEIFELGLRPDRCTVGTLQRLVPDDTVGILRALIDAQGHLRSERNRRIHHGSERSFTDDDETFRTASIFERWSNGMTGHDQFGRPIDLERSFNEGLVLLQGDFNRVTRELKRLLDILYDELHAEFEERFGPRIRSATHGLNAGVIRN
jgi:hypothetical protein